MTPYFPKAKVRKEHNLLSGQPEKKEEEAVEEVSSLVDRKSTHINLRLSQM